MRYNPEQTRAICEILEGMQAEAFRAEGITPICKPGCSHCCHEVIEGSDIEARMVVYALGLLDRATRRGVHRRLTKWAKHYRKLGRHPTTEAYLRAGLMCPLNSQGLCLIYPYRPMGCRTYVNTVSPTQCKPDRSRYYDYPLVQEVIILSVLIFANGVSPIHFRLLEAVAAMVGIVDGAMGRNMPGELISTYLSMEGSLRDTIEKIDKAVEGIE